MASESTTITKIYTITVTRTEEDLSLTPPQSDPMAPVESTATYTVTFQGGWTTTVTPGGVPSGAHFSRLIGAVHNANVTFLEGGGAAATGIESMAETGGTGSLRREVGNAEPNSLSVIEGDTDFIGPTCYEGLDGYVNY